MEAVPSHVRLLHLQSFRPALHDLPAQKQRPATLWLQEIKQHISQLVADIKKMCSRLESSVGQLTLHTVGLYEAKRPNTLLDNRKKAR